jgi:hypothetical protein
VAEYADTPEEMRKKAQSFFAQAKAKGEGGQYDYAIEMYLGGLALDPEAHEAHVELREVSMRRKANGGKSLGMFEKLKGKATKDPKTAMLAYERVLAHDPGDTDAMVGVLTQGNKGGFWDTVLWMGPILLRANLESAKPDIKKFLVLKDVYRDLKKYDLAVEACHFAARMKPEDLELSGELKNLSAMETMHKGNYADSQGFRGSMANRDEQDKLLGAERDVKSQTFLDKRIAEAEAQYKADPNEPGKLSRLVEALVGTEQMEHENRAIELLQEWYERTKQYRFRKNIGVINMKIWNRMRRAREEEAKLKPNDAKVQEDYKNFLKDKWEFELGEYAQWAENYPTDMSIRFEWAKRLFELGRYNEAIPALQQSANDPKNRSESAILLGRAFYEAGYFDEASQVLETGINEYTNRNDEKSKQLFYWRGRALEEMNEIEAALKHYSQVAQWQFGYEDVNQRVKKLREDRNKR